MWCDVIGFWVSLFCFYETAFLVAVNSSWAATEISHFLVLVLFFFLQSKYALVKNTFNYHIEKTKSILLLL